MLGEFFDGALDGCGAIVGLGIAFAIAGILAPVVINPYVAVAVCGLVILGALARMSGHFSADPGVRAAEPGIDPVTLTRLPDQRVHVMSAIGLVLLMVLWILVVLRQFAAATIGSLLVMLVWGTRILVHQGRDPRRFDEFEDTDYVQTVFITMGAGFVLLIAFVPLFSE